MTFVSLPNAFSAISSADAGISISLSAVQPPKAFLPIVFKPVSYTHLAGTYGQEGKAAVLGRTHAEFRLRAGKIHACGILFRERHRRFGFRRITGGTGGTDSPSARRGDAADIKELTGK